MMNWNGYGSGRSLILMYYVGIRLEGLRKSTKSFSQGSRSPGRDWTRDVPNTKQES